LTVMLGWAVKNEPNKTTIMTSHLRMPEYRKIKCCTALQLLAVNFEKTIKIGST
jgi:hypothetical protein